MFSSIPVFFTILMLIVSLDQICLTLNYNNYGIGKDISSFKAMYS